MSNSMAHFVSGLFSCHGMLVSQLHVSNVLQNPTTAKFVCRELLVLNQYEAGPQFVQRFVNGVGPSGGVPTLYTFLMSWLHNVQPTPCDTPPIGKQPTPCPSTTSDDRASL